MTPWRGSLAGYPFRGTRSGFRRTDTRLVSSLTAQKGVPPVIVVRAIFALCLFAGMYSLFCLPAYLIAQRRGVRSPGAAFVPLVGIPIALLWSIGRSGWMALLAIVPFANFLFWIWLAFTLPSHHRRSLVWGLVLLVPVLGWYAYAFTLPWERKTHGFTAEPRRA